MIFTGLIRNLLATIVSLLLIVGIYYVFTVPEYVAVFNKFAIISYPLVAFIMNGITRLTTWKGDDSLWAYVWKDIKKKRRTG